METKLRWFQSEQVSPALLNKFADAITAHPFTAESSRGFLVTKRRSGSLTARFIEKVSGSREIVDPFGNRLQLPFVTYEMVRFRISCEFPNLELLNAAKSPRKLFFFLTEISKESFAMSPVEIDVKKWIAEIGSTFGNIEVTEIKYHDLMVSPDVAADVAFYGTRNVVVEARNFIGKRSASVAKAKLSATIENRRLALELSAGGTLKANTSLDGKIVDDLRGTLAATVAKTQ